MKIAYSTTVCPGWTLDQAVNTASDLGYLGLEMRSFIEPEPAMMCDPMRMAPDAVDDLFDQAGVTPVSLATGVRFDKPVFPPVVGHILRNTEEGVQETKEFVNFAARSGTKYVRVYGFELPASEPRAWGIRRVAERLALASQTARNTDTRILIENGGSFARASDLLELINYHPNQWLKVCYDINTARLAGECPIQGVKLLKDHLHCVRLSDVDAEHNPVPFAQGVVPNKQVVTALDSMGFEGWLVYSYPKLWIQEDARNPSKLLKHACDTLYSWMQSDDLAFDETAVCDEPDCACAAS